MNLLTLKEKKSIKREYIVRVVTVAVMFLFFTMVFAVAGILPAYFQVTVDLKIKQDDLEQLAVESEREGDDTVALALAKTDTILGFLSPEEKTDRVLSTEVVRSALVARPSGVQVTTLSFDSSENGRVLTILGVAGTRGALIEYSRSLEEQPSFLRVNIPAEDLAETENIEFRITVEGDF